MNWGIPNARHLRGKENPRRAYERNRRADKLVRNALDRLNAAKETRKAAPKNPPETSLAVCILKV
jgi:hypothetical protein